MTTDYSKLERPIHPMPDFVRQALEARNLMSDYSARPAYQQNDYIGWINRAKRPATKEKRLQQMLDELEEGGVYMKMAHPASAKEQSATDHTSTVPTDVTFHRDTLRRVGHRGDNWCLTWAADDSQITSMDDGKWIDDGEAWQYHNHLYRIVGGPEDFTKEEIPNYPDYRMGDGGWFGYGIVAVDDLLYAAISKTPGPRWSGPFPGVKLLRSADNGQSWQRVDRSGNLRDLTPYDPARHAVDRTEIFFWQEAGLPHKSQPAYPFAYFDFVQSGRADAAAQDDFLYLYSPEGAHAHRLLLARVDKHALGNRAAWQFFCGYDQAQQPQWSPNLAHRQPAHRFPAQSTDGHYFGWYSWLPSVVWNEGLQLYIMVNGGTYAGHGMTDSDEDYYHPWMHTETGSLGFWYAHKPYGPWHQFFYTDYWVADSPANRTYQPKLSPKWISDSGREMVLIWSDAMRNEEGKSHSTNYMWNQMVITIA